MPFFASRCSADGRYRAAVYSLYEKTLTILLICGLAYAGEPQDLCELGLADDVRFSDKEGAAATPGAAA